MSHRQYRTSEELIKNYYELDYSEVKEKLSSEMKTRLPKLDMQKLTKS